MYQYHLYPNMDSPVLRSIKYLEESPQLNMMRKSVGFKSGLSDAEYYQQITSGQLPLSINIPNIDEESEWCLKHQKCLASSTDKQEEPLRTKKIKGISDSPYKVSTLSKRSPVATPVQSSGDRLIFKVKKADSRKRLKPLSTVEDFVYKKRIKIGSEEYKISMISNEKTLIIEATNVNTSEKFDLKLKSHEAEKVIGGKINYDTLAHLILIDQGRLLLRNSEALHQRRLDDVSLVKKKVIGERDIVGGYILRYDSTQSDPYQPKIENQEQPRIKEFVFYSIGRDEDLWKLVQSQTEFRRKSNSPSKKFIKIRTISASSSNSNFQRHVNNNQTKATRYVHREYMSQSTGMSSNSRHISLADSLSTESINELHI
jgi:hypothetical protein